MGLLHQLENIDQQFVAGQLDNGFVKIAFFQQNVVKVIGLYSCFKTFVDALELLVILVRAAADGQLGGQRLEYRCALPDNLSFALRGSQTS